MDEGTRVMGPSIFLYFLKCLKWIIFYLSYILVLNVINLEVSISEMPIWKNLWFPFLTLFSQPGTNIDIFLSQLTIVWASRSPF